MTNRVMYDSVTLSAIPRNATMVAAYVDGSYKNDVKVRTGWPHALHVYITVTGRTYAAHVIDCEKGDATPETAAKWAKAKVRTRHEHPTIYCSESLWPTVKAAVRAQGLKADEVSYWIAHYDNNPTLLPGEVAKQYKSTTKPNLDTSIVADYWPGVDPPAKSVAAKKTASTPTKPVAKPVAKTQPTPNKTPAKKPAPAPTFTPQDLSRLKSALYRHHLSSLYRRILGWLGIK